MTAVLIRNPHEDTANPSRKNMIGNEGRDGNEVATNQGAEGPPKARRGRERVFPRTWERA